MKAKKKLLIGTAIMALAAGGASAVSTMAWYSAVLDTTVGGTNNVASLSISDPSYHIGAPVGFTVDITEMKGQETTGSRGTLYLSAVKNSNSLVTCYLDANKDPHEYTPSGTQDTDWTFTKVYKVHVKLTAAVEGSNAIALRSKQVRLKVERYDHDTLTSSALFEKQASFSSLTHYGATETSITVDNFHTFAADYSSGAANDTIGTDFFLAVRVDGGSISTRAAAASGTMYADFKVTLDEYSAS